MVAPHSGIFQGCNFTFGRSIPISSKSKLSAAIRKHGGSTSAFVTPSITHFVVDGWEAKAATTTASVVPATYISDCLEQMALLPELPYLVTPGAIKREPTFSFFDDLPDHEASLPAPESATELVHRLLASASRNIAAVRVAGAELHRKQAASSAPSRATLPCRSLTPTCESRLSSRPDSAAKRLQAARLEREAQRAARKAEQEQKKAERMAALEARRKEYATYSSTTYSSTLPSNPTFTSSTSVSNRQSALDFILSTPITDYSSYSSSNSPQSPEDLKLKEEEEKKERARKKARRKRHRARQRKRLEAEAQALKDQQKAAVKERVRANINANAEEGARRAKLLAAAKEQARCDEVTRKCVEATEKDLAWMAEQEKRRADWALLKKQEKEEKRRKKAAFLANRARILAEDRSERGRKLFVGKLTFADIVEKHKNKPYVIENRTEERKELCRSIFRMQGHVESFKESPDMWSKGHFFVVYCSAIDAANAVAKLQDYAYRKATVSKMGELNDAVPPPSFYVRWPRNTNLSIDGKIAPSEPVAKAAKDATLATSAASTPTPKPIVLPAELRQALDQYADSDWQVV